MRAVEGEGPARAKIMLVGEQPGNEEDLIGHPFVGPAGRAGEIDACHIWLEREIAAVKPRVIVTLGATALRSITGRSSSIDSARRQELVHPAGARVLATYHPSAILRAQGERIEELRTRLIDDLRMAAHISSREQA